MQIVQSMLDHLAAEHPETYAYAKEITSESFSVVAKLEGEPLHVYGDGAFDGAVDLAYKGVNLFASEYEPAKDLLGQCFHLGLILAMAALAGQVDVVIHRDPDPGMNDPSTESEVYNAVEVLFRYRHLLPNDVLRSVQSIYGCTSAARFGEEYEPMPGADFYREHDTAKCEATS